jgi:hypothetical protein
VISAAKIDPRMKAIATVSMYDMGGATRNALHHSQTVEQRKRIIAEAAEQRYVEFTGGDTKYTSGTVHKLDENTDPIQREFYDFYRTPRGEYTPEGSSPELTTHSTLSSSVKFMNFYPLADLETISPRPMLFITGENAHSREFSEEAYRLAGQPKELVVVPAAGHVDLYDRVNLIPFDKLSTFFTKYLKQRGAHDSWERHMDIQRSGSQPSVKGPSDWFTGTVRIDYGWAQPEGGPVEEIRPGDVVWSPPGERHWHGATATTGMTHIAIQEKLNGSAVDWMEKVTDKQDRRSDNRKAPFTETARREER